MADKQFNSLYTAENERLFNLLFRHQVYLEGVKSGFGGDYTKMLRDLYSTFSMYMGRSRYQTLDGYSKVELANFVRLFQQAQQRFYSSYTDKVIALLQNFMATDVTVTRAIFNNVTGIDTEDIRDGAADADVSDDEDSIAHGVTAPMLGHSVVGDDEESNAALWSRISNAPMPANGMTIENTLLGFGYTSAVAVQNELNKGYANKYTGIQTLNAIVGNPDNSFRDGLFARFNVQNASLLGTAIQHVSSMQQAAIGSVYYTRYQWVSIMDNKTTPICISRNGKVYIYGKGPLPPAHYLCRSKDIPLAGDQEVHDIPASFSDWLVTQPESYLQDALGIAVAKQVMDGNFSNANFSAIGTVRPLTLEQFAAKLPYILGD
jgi:SPP1 gp7 family putative phage head morphogenesis protein